MIKLFKKACSHQSFMDQSFSHQFLAQALALAVVAGALFFAPDAHSYEFISMGRCSSVTWAANRQPLDYYINQNGYSQMNMSTVQRIMEDSFDAWAEPCCSSFSAGYAGQTSQTAMNTQSQVVLSFEERNWPSQMGSANQTIAVTLVQGTATGCNIYNAPILFNGVGFRFCEGASGGCTDLQSIATHEIGHNLGLDHSEYQSATMYYAYSGGTSARNLSDDDIAGVCALYPGSCSCSRDSDCGPRQICQQGQCEQAPCTDDASCPSRQVCNPSSGQCEVPTCSRDGDCQDGFICDSSNHCVSDCPVCRTCTENRDCGAGGFCNAGSCIVSCSPSGDCPGDSACFAVPAAIASSGECTSNAHCQGNEECYGTGGNNGICATPCTSDNSCSGDDMCMDFGDGEAVYVCAETYPLCLNPTVNSQGLCPENYTCHDSTPGGSNNDPFPDGCDMSNTCADVENHNCVEGNDVCLGMEDGSPGMCSCTCTRDSECGADGTCYDFGQGNKACVPNELLEPDGNNNSGNNNPSNPPGNNNSGNNQSGNNNAGNNDPGHNNPTDPTNPGGNNNPADPSDTDGPDAGGSSDAGGQADAGDKTSDKEQKEGSKSDDGCGCSSTPMQDDIPASWLLLGVAGLGIVWRRRR